MNQKTKAPAITLKPCKSSMIQAHGYDPESKTLEVQFNGGKSYRLSNVPADLYDQMGKAESIGKFYNAHLRGKFDTTATA